MQIARACKSIIYYLVVRHVYKVFDGILILRLKHRKRILTALKEKKKTKKMFNSQTWKMTVYGLGWMVRAQRGGGVDQMRVTKWSRRVKTTGQEVGRRTKELWDYRLWIKWKLIIKQWSARERKNIKGRFSQGRVN